MACTHVVCLGCLTTGPGRRRDPCPCGQSCVIMHTLILAVRSHLVHARMVRLAVDGPSCARMHGCRVLERCICASAGTACVQVTAGLVRDRGACCCSERWTANTHAVERRQADYTPSAWPLQQQQQHVESVPVVCMTQLAGGNAAPVLCVQMWSVTRRLRSWRRWRKGTSTS